MSRSGWRRSIRQRALIRFVKRVTEATPSAIVNLIDAPTASCLEDSFSGDNTNTVLKQGNPGGPLRGPAGDAKPPGNERLASGAARNRLRPPARGPASGQLAPLRHRRPYLPAPFPRTVRPREVIYGPARSKGNPTLGIGEHSWRGAGCLRGLQVAGRRPSGARPACGHANQRDGLIQR